MSLPTIARRVRVTGTIVVIATLAGCAADPPAGVVGLTVTGCSTGEAHGSGIVVAPGLVLTAAHVVKGADEIDVTNGARSTTASVVAFDPDMDLAYVRLDDDLPGSTIELADSAVERGERGVAYVFRDGHVVALPVVVRRPVRIKTEDIYIEGDTNRPGFELDADIGAGDSGGPVLVDGKVVGVLWARSSKYEHRAYAIDPVAAGGLVREQLRAGAIDDSIDLARCT
jgi:S1-C subfamily serine protease